MADYLACMHYGKVVCLLFTPDFRSIVMHKPLKFLTCQRYDLRSIGHTGNQKPTESVISKLLLKAICKSTKQAPKTITFCDVDIASVKSLRQLKKVTREQLQDDLNLM